MEPGLPSGARPDGGTTHENGMNAQKRLLMYSHDSFGLGHLRRCRTIAHALVDRFEDLSVLILSGSAIIGSFDFWPRVDFVRMPGVIKLRNGEYTPQRLRIDIEKTLEIRSAIIQRTAEVFDPHLFLVDKEPLGLRGEVVGTLEMLRLRGARCVLGLRDVMDEPASLIEEWRRKDVFPALENLYDEIWVYGLPEIFDPLAEIPGMARVEDKVRFTGYLRRSLPAGAPPPHEIELPEDPFILVTTGGGDGADLVDWVISAYETDPDIPYRALLVLGPFMNLEERTSFQERAARLAKLRTTTFEARIEHLYERAAGVIAMGGYNTFCEILSFNRPALIVPRTVPRREQALRARRAAQLGLLRVLEDDGVRDPRRMAAEIRRLAAWPRPDDARAAHFLTGLETIAELAAPWLDGRRVEPALLRFG